MDYGITSGSSALRLNIIFDGFVNRQNSRVWGSENPRVIVEKQMQPQRVTFWCGFWAGGITGRFYFENAAGQAITVNRVRYRDMISQFFWCLNC